MLWHRGDATKERKEGTNEAINHHLDQSNQIKSKGSIELQKFKNSKKIHANFANEEGISNAFAFGIFVVVVVGFETYK